jgi:hypothetical protein
VLGFEITSRQEVCSGPLFSNSVPIQWVPRVLGIVSASEAKAVRIAEAFLFRQPFRDNYESLAARISGSGDNIEVFFKRKTDGTVKHSPSEGLIRVNTKTWRAKWIPLE